MTGDLACTLLEIKPAVLVTICHSPIDLSKPQHLMMEQWVHLMIIHAPDWIYHIAKGWQWCWLSICFGLVFYEHQRIVAIILISPL